VNKAGKKRTVNGDDPVLQPLREIGTTVKTQFWDPDDIKEALREAIRRGISLEDFGRGGDNQKTTALQQS